MARGSEPMIESVHGAITLRHAEAHQHRHPDDVRARCCSAGTSRTGRTTVATSSEPGGDDQLVAEALHPHVDSGAKIIIVIGLREQHRAGLRPSSSRAPTAGTASAGTACRTATRNTSVIAPLAALNRGFSKKRMSSIGWLECSSHTKNAASTTKPTTNAAMISGERPAVARRLDDRPQDRAERDDRQHRADRVERGVRRVASTRGRGSSRARGRRSRSARSR